MMKRRELEHAEKEQSDFKFDLETKINANQRFQIRKTLKAIVVPVFLAVLMRVSYWMQPKQPERGRLFQTTNVLSFSVLLSNQRELLGESSITNFRPKNKTEISVLFLSLSSSAPSLSSSSSSDPGDLRLPCGISKHFVSNDKSYDQRASARLKVGLGVLGISKPCIEREEETDEGTEHSAAEPNWKYCGVLRGL